MHSAQSTVSKQDWRTPPQFIEFVERYVGRIDIDGAASKENAVAKVFWTKEEDTLNRSWEVGGKHIFINPEFKLSKKFAEKATEELLAGSNFVASLLVPASMTSNWYDECADSCGTSLLRPRIPFLDAMGQPGEKPPGGCMLLVFGVAPAVGCIRRVNWLPEVPDPYADEMAKQMNFEDLPGPKPAKKKRAKK